MRGIENNGMTHGRNQSAVEIFTRNGFSVRILGNDQSPMFILDDCYLLSCFVNGNNLYFRPSPDSGDITRTIRLGGDSYITKFEIAELIERSEHLPVFRIQHEESKMCLVGFNRFNPEEDETDAGFPVFANYNPIIYINPGKADGVVQDLIAQGYNVKVI